MAFELTANNISLLILIELATLVPLFYWWFRRKDRKRDWEKEIPEEELIKLKEEIKNGKKEITIGGRDRIRETQEREPAIERTISEEGDKRTPKIKRRVQIPSPKPVDRDKRKPKKDWEQFD